MALIDLSGYGSVEAATFVKITIDGYGDLNMSNHRVSYTIGSDTYNTLGDLLAVTEATSELTASDKRITITISGVPQGNRNLVENYYVKGSPVEIRRAFFDPVTGALLSVAGNPALRFTGIVTNFGISEDWNQNDKTASNTIMFDCASTMILAKRKKTGRKTNPDDFPADRSFDRVPQLSQSNFAFGAKAKK
jgi:hypothetical protein